MTRGKYYSVAMPLAGILYAIVLIVVHNSTVTVVGAMLFAVVAVAGSAFKSRGA